MCLQVNVPLLPQRKRLFLFVYKITQKLYGFAWFFCIDIRTRNGWLLFAGDPEHHLEFELRLTPYCLVGGLPALSAFLVIIFYIFFNPLWFAVEQIEIMKLLKEGEYVDLKPVQFVKLFRPNQFNRNCSRYSAVNIGLGPFCRMVHPLYCKACTQLAEKAMLGILYLM